MICLLKASKYYDLKFITNLQNYKIWRRRRVTQVLFKNRSRSALKCRISEKSRALCGSSIYVFILLNPNKINGVARKSSVYTNSRSRNNKPEGVIKWNRINSNYFGIVCSTVLANASSSAGGHKDR